ncbi:MAG: RDD family protein [Simkaniaceae bacterium]|nr:RDD family protein [Simkaniaceae bacterium]
MKNWKIFFSTLIDYSLLLIVLRTLVSLTSIHIEGLWGLSGILFATALVWLFFETLSIKFFKASPGHAIFGIRVTEENRKRLSLLRAFKFALLKHPIFWKKDTLPTLNQRRRLSSRFIALAFAAVCLSFSAIVEHFSEPISVLAVGGNQSFKWKQFALPEKAVVVDMPKNPEVVEKKLDLPKTDKKLDVKEYVAKHHKEDVHFSISYTELPKSIMRWSSSLILKGTLKVVVSNEKGASLKSKDLGKFKSHPCIDYTLKQGDKEFRGRLVLVGNVLYKLNVLYPESNKADVQPSAKNFFDSFKP